MLSVRCCTLGSLHCISHCRRTSSFAGPSYKEGCPPLRNTTMGCLLLKAKCCHRLPPTDLTTQSPSARSTTSTARPTRLRPLRTFDHLCDCHPVHLHQPNTHSFA